MDSRQRADPTLTAEMKVLAHSRPSDLAFSDYGGSGLLPRRFTWREFAETVDAVAEGLLGLGVRAGDPVSFQLPNCYEFALVHAACSRIGALSNPILPILREREVGFILDRLESRVFICVGEYRGFDFSAMARRLKGKIRTLAHNVVVSRDLVDEQSCDLSFATLVASPSPVDPHHLESLSPGAQDPAVVMYTSGTTGEPKGVVHSHYSLYMGVRGVPETLRLTGEDAVLMFSPLAHGTGLMYGVCMPILFGMRVAFMDGWDPTRMLAIAEAEKSTWTAGTTTFALDACASARSSGTRLQHLRYFHCGGAPIPEHLVWLTRETLGCELVAVWGMTEVGSATMTLPNDPMDRVAGSDGKPLPWVQLRIVDDQGRPVPSGQAGRLLVKSPSQNVAYFDRNDLFAASFEDGWFATGDLARQDAQGYIRITGREKDLVVRGGENVPVLEVEQLLLTHDRVAEVAIIGYPDRRLGERCCAFVVPTGGTTIRLDELTAFLDEMGMAKQFWPERLEVRLELPKTASGKILKSALRGEFW